MVGATRPGRVLLIFAAVAACSLGGVGALWFGLIPSLSSGKPSQPQFDVSEALASQLREPHLTEREPVYVGTDLEQVPEVNLEPTPAVALGKYGTQSTEQWLALKSSTRSNAVALNDKEEDGFVKALTRTRSDLSGLPFLLGNACRANPERAQAFKAMVEMTRERDRATRLLRQQQAGNEIKEKRRQDRRALAALLAQTLPAEAVANQPTKVLSLASIDEPEATRELARVAVFSPESTARNTALLALARREPRDSTDVLLAGLRYPWPAVAKNAAHAIMVLKRKDLIPQVQRVLDEPDPRGPRTEMLDGKAVEVADEVVRINHHRNCLLCHAPAVEGKTPKEALTAEIPLPSERLRDGIEYYERPQASARRDLLVRIDVTYLRPDFSAVQPVYDSSAWRKMQRFDFVVRKRVLTPDEARDLRERLKGPSPYHAAAAEALR
jgi:hypothetical protein